MGRFAAGDKEEGAFQKKSPHKAGISLGVRMNARGFVGAQGVTKSSSRMSPNSVAPGKGSLATAV